VCASLHAIARHPESYPVIGRRLRRALTSRFPFAIFYILDGDTVRVFGVLHTSRSPRVWQARDH